ncbi:MAG: thiamine pyrophosphate-dependent enzyme [Thermoflexibacter sp.]|nr:thiamine pyrophosphate-dependent enzyme [Thermoflexibacter sp.]
MDIQTLTDIDTYIYTKEEVLNDYRIACESRYASLAGRKEVFAGKAKFGIFGDGKEIAQIAMAKAFKKGDWRSGYYRDQTFMFALNELTIEQYFAQLYAHPSLKADPATAGRCMNAHFVTRSLDEKGEWNKLSEMHNSAADVSCTAGQMPRLVGLAWASKLYRNNPDLHQFEEFSIKGNEVAFGTIGNASTSEGHFWEAVNAAGVLQIPMLLAIWDDGYGISVGQEYHTTKGDLYKVLKGFQRNENEQGIELFQVKGWDYEGLCNIFKYAAEICRNEHIPAVIHVCEMTQPQGHSTSGSHERYKSKERLKWEEEYDCIKKFEEWILTKGIAKEAELQEINQNAKLKVNNAKLSAWRSFVDEMKSAHEEALRLLEETIYALGGQAIAQKNQLNQVKEGLRKTLNPIYSDSVRAIKKALRILRFEDKKIKENLQNWLSNTLKDNEERFSSHLYSQSADSALKVKEVKAQYDEDSRLADGREVLQANFDAIFAKNPKVIAFGEDVGKIGDVNQAFAGLQAKYGEVRISDTSIRELTIIGQGIGTAMRGLRPIAEIQYLDYIYYGLQPLVDDVSCLQYRTKGGQKAPLIVRSRGHRLEGIWHSGSPIGMLLHSLRGMYLLVPRNMTQAAGFYNTLLQSDDPALIIECLNGYRLKERIPKNLGEFTVPLGIPEVIKEGKDVTIVTYGSMCRVVLEASEQLYEVGISCEIIDVQSLLPFDINHTIAQSIKKTSRVIFADEDVPGGAAAYMMQQVIEGQNTYQYLDSKPICVTAKAHRPPYGSDGDYFSKPNPENIIDAVYEVMSEANPKEFPDLYS